MFIFFRSIILSCLFVSNIFFVAPVYTQTELINPIGGTETNKKGDTDIRVIFGNIIKQGLTIVGSIAFVVFLVGGAYWLVSGGNDERVKKGTQTMVWAVIGLFVIFSSYGILSAVIGGLT